MTLLIIILAIAAAALAFHLWLKRETRNKLARGAIAPRAAGDARAPLSALPQAAEGVAPDP